MCTLSDLLEAVKDSVQESQNLELETVIPVLVSREVDLINLPLPIL